MFHIVLFEPQIAPNTGNIIRLCANCGADLHLIHPLGFRLEDKRLRRAGLDYHEWARLSEHATFAKFKEQMHPRRCFAFSTKGQRRYNDVRYHPQDALVFGPETSGLPPEILAEIGTEQVLRLPMRPNSRSLNLSNAVAIVLYHAWQQLGFPGAN